MAWPARVSKMAGGTVLFGTGRIMETLGERMGKWYALVVVAALSKPSDMDTRK